MTLSGDRTRVWFITGAGRGFGRLFTESAARRAQWLASTVLPIPEPPASAVRNLAGPEPGPGSREGMAAHWAGQAAWAGGPMRLRTGLSIHAGGAILRTGAT